MFSVVIPLYNKVHTIVETLHSVLLQDFLDFEVVVVDDGSTDGSLDMVARCFDDPRVRIIHQENLGEGGARNSGIAAARYDLIALLDADDLWLPGYLSEMNDAVREFPDAGMFCCGGVSRYPDGSGYIRQSDKYGDSRQKVDYFEAPFFFGNASSIVFSKKKLALTGGFPVAMAHHADIVFFFKLALKTEVVFCPSLLTVYNLGIPGQAVGDRRANTRAIVDSSNQIYGFWDSLESEEKNPSCLSAIMQNLRDGIRYSFSNSDYELLDYFLQNTNSSLLDRLTNIEKFIYKRPRLRSAALARIWAATLADATGRPPERPGWRSSSSTRSAPLNSAAQQSSRSSE